MTGRRRRRGSSSASTGSRLSRGAIHHTGSTRTRASSATLRRSERLSRLLATQQEEAGPSTARPRSPPLPENQQPLAEPRLDRAPSDRSVQALQELIAAEENLPITGTTPRGHRRVRSSPRNQRPYYDLGPDGSSSPYSMNVLIEPPEYVRPGDILDPPLVIRLDQTVDQHLAGRPVEDYSLLWAVLSVVTEDGRTMLAPPRADLLTGTRVDSVHALTPLQEEREIGFMAFPDLAIRDPGRYRIMVSLVRMNPLGTATVGPAGINVQNTSSRVIVVDPNAERPRLGDEERELLNNLRERGLHTMSRLSP